MTENMTVYFLKSDGQGPGRGERISRRGAVGSSSNAQIEILERAAPSASPHRDLRRADLPKEFLCDVSSFFFFISS